MKQIKYRNMQEGIHARINHKGKLSFEVTLRDPTYDSFKIYLKRGPIIYCGRRSDFWFIFRCCLRMNPLVMISRLPAVLHYFYDLPESSWILFLTTSTFTSFDVNKLRPKGLVYLSLTWNTSFFENARKHRKSDKMKWLHKAAQPRISQTTWMEILHPFYCALGKVHYTWALNPDFGVVSKRIIQTRKCGKLIWVSDESMWNKPRVFFILLNCLYNL